ncbi:hypothetical protein [Mycolicibacterium sphagni]|uniref:hypothetical protein n=1 Tax=Mycolicibacterium sphagni TaxID=1786 RepID=UPI0031F4C1DC
MITRLTLPQSTHPAHITTTHHGHGGSGFFDILFRGFAWRTGEDVANNLFHMAPGLITLLVVAALLFFGIRWALNRRRS